jgi:hypothetical protein
MAVRGRTTEGPLPHPSALPPRRCHSGPRRVPRQAARHGPHPTHHFAVDLGKPGLIQLLDLNRSTPPRTVALVCDARVPQADVLPPRPLSIQDVVTVALERLEDYLVDIYEHGRTMGDPMVLWANRAAQMLREILDCFPPECLAST